MESIEEILVKLWNKLEFMIRWPSWDEVLTKVRVFPVFREQAITIMERAAIGYLFFLPLKLGIEQTNKVPGKIKISYLSVEIFERPLNIPKHLSIENIGILYNYALVRYFVSRII